MNNDVWNNPMHREWPTKPEPATDTVTREPLRWQPIATAPKDGTWVFVWSAGPNYCHEDCIYIASYYPEYERWESGAARVSPDPSHWMPLPEPPTEADRG